MRGRPLRPVDPRVSRQAVHVAITRLDHPLAATLSRMTGAARSVAPQAIGALRYGTAMAHSHHLPASQDLYTHPITALRTPEGAPVRVEKNRCRNRSNLRRLRPRRLSQASPCRPLQRRRPRRTRQHQPARRRRRHRQWSRRRRRPLVRPLLVQRLRVRCPARHRTHCRTACPCSDPRQMARRRRPSRR